MTELASHAIREHALHERDPPRDESATAPALAHLLLFLVALVAWSVGLYVIVILAASGATSPTEAAGVARGLAALYALVTAGVIAPNVGYRWFDAFLVLIPFFGVLIFIPKMLWRLTSIPYRYWEASVPPMEHQAIPPAVPPVVDQSAALSIPAAPSEPSPTLTPMPPAVVPEPERTRFRLSVPVVALIVTLAVVALIVAVAWFGSLDRNTSESADPVPSATPSVSQAKDGPKGPDVCTVRKRLAAISTRTNRLFSRSFDRFQAAASDSAKAEVLSEAAAQASILSIDLANAPRHPRLKTSRDLLARALQAARRGFSELSVSWNLSDQQAGARGQNHLREALALQDQAAGRLLKVFSAEDCLFG